MAQMKRTPQECSCQAAYCKHHTITEPCPNPVTVSFPFDIDPASGSPKHNSASGLCQECFTNKVAESE
jgi:hypothetical protein